MIASYNKNRTRNVKNRLFFTLVFCFFFTITQASPFADKDYYLVDSLDLSQLTKLDIQLIDSCMKVFHSAKADTTKINALSGICENMEHENWIKFQYIQKELINKTIATVTSPEEKLQLSKLLCVAYQNMGFYYYRKGDIPGSIQKFNKSLEMSEKMDYTEGIADALNSIGYINIQQENINEGIESYQRALSIYRTLKAEGSIGRTLNNIGMAYYSLNDYENAKKYFKKSLVIREKTGDKKGYATSINNLALIARSEGNIPETIAYLKKSMKIFQQMGDKQGLTNSLVNIGTLSLDEGDAIAAEKYGKQALAIAQQLNHIQLKKVAAELLSKVYEKQKKGIQALKMQKLYISMRDSLNNRATQRAVAQQQAKHEYEKQKVADDADNEKRIAIEVEKKQQQKIVIYGISALLSLIVAFLIFIFNRLRVTKKQKEIIESQKKEVEQRDAEKEILLREIHHRVKNNLQIVSSMLSIQSRQMENETAKKMLQESRNRVKTMALIHKKLYMKEDLANINFKEYTVDLCETLFSSYKQPHQQIDLTVDINNIELNINKAIPLGLILNELVTNSLKYAFKEDKNGNINIIIHLINDVLTLTVQDNGCGMPENYTFEKSSSFGFSLVKSLCGKLEADLQINSTKGTEVIIEITGFSEKLTSLQE